MGLNGTAIVTGGGRGIGQAISVELARRGANVAIVDIDADGMAETEALIEDIGQEAFGIETNLTQLDQVQNAVESALSEFDSVQYLVNNAGIAGPTSPCESVTPEEWDQTMNVNLRGPFFMCREVLPHMKERSFGRIVNIASVTGKRPLPNRTPYATAKMGVIGFTRTLAAEVGEHDINVNAVCPGSVNGPRIRRVFERQAEAEDKTFEEVKAAVEEESARGELVDQRDIANTVAYLCSADSERMTGQDINVSAGKVMY